MQTITKFKAYDGTEFNEFDKCETYEANCRSADAIIAQLQPLPVDDGCRFANGHGYIQHGRTLFIKVRRELLELANIESPHKWLDQSLAVDYMSVHPSWAGRIIDECCTGRLNKAWRRIMCTDNQFREWGQPFYADNPDKGEHINLTMPCEPS